MIYYIKTSEKRPDYRLIITFLWNDFAEVDTSGNASNPASHEWTELECSKRRSLSKERFAILPVEGKTELILRIESPSPELAARVTYFLAKEMRTEYGNEPHKICYDSDELTSMMGEDFDVSKAMQRVLKSIWQRATLDNPYPQKLQNSN